MNFYDWLSWLFRRDKHNQALSDIYDWFISELRDAWTNGTLVEQTVSNFETFVVYGMGYEPRQVVRSEALGFINGNVELLWLAFTHATNRGT